MKCRFAPEKKEIPDIGLSLLFISKGGRESDRTCEDAPSSMVMLSGDFR
jgi:hypothetical protein